MIRNLVLFIPVSPASFDIILMCHLQDIGYVSLRHSGRGWRCHQLKPYAIFPQDLLMLSSKYFSVPMRSLHHQRDGVGTKVSLCFSSITSIVFQLVSLPFILSPPINSPLQFPKYRSDGSLSCLKLFKSSQLT